ncbi:MAG: PAS domain-containing sensor histidine kinase [Candidatus Helarchaeota archaeon]
MEYSYEHYREIIENVRDIIIEFYPDGIIYYISPQIFEMLGYQPLEIIGHKIQSLIHPTDQRKFLKKIKETLESGETINEDLRIRHRTGNYLVISFRGSLMRGKGKPKFIAVLRDISMRKKMENDLRDAFQKIQLQNEELRKLDKLKDEFYEDVCHELFTPLISIKGFIEFLLNYKKLERGIYQDLQVILRNEIRLENLINNIINYSRLKSGRVVLKKDRFRPSEIIRKILDDLEPIFREENFDFEIILGSDDYLVFDKLQIQRLLTNLIMNAIAFSKDSGKILIESKVEETVWKCSIRDYGIGIKAQDIPNLFSHANQERRADGVVIEGLGFGLASCKKIVESYRGKIWAESEGLEKGATFHFELKLEQDLEQQKLKQDYQCSEPSKTGSPSK